MKDGTIRQIELARFTGTRPRSAGSNARLGVHGPTIDVPLVRITTADGASGFSRGTARTGGLDALLGVDIDSIVSPDGVDSQWRGVEFALFDLAARRAEVPVFRYLAPDAPESPRVRVYDTTLYFDDLHLDDDAEAVALIVQEARDGLAAGHRDFKIKIGRGARHMPLERGMARDLAIIRAIREVAGPNARIMVDANNGFNLNLTKQLLRETADLDLFWMEEAFHEDPVLYRDLKDWLVAEGLKVRIADGEGSAHPDLLDFARDGLIDVVQYDIFSYGFSPWLTLGAELDELGILSAPHNYGSVIGNYATGHLAGRVRQLASVEWDGADVPGLDASAYVVADGHVTLPEGPGFDLVLDEERFAAAVANGGVQIR